MAGQHQRYHHRVQHPSRLRRRRQHHQHRPPNPTPKAVDEEAKKRGLEGNAHVDSCIYLAETSPIDITEDTNPDDIFAAHEDAVRAIFSRGG